MLSYAIRAAFQRRAATRSFLLPHNANLFAYLVSWVAFSFSFGAICIAVEETATGFTPSARRSLLNVREAESSARDAHSSVVVETRRLHS